MSFNGGRLGSGHESKRGRTKSWSGVTALAPHDDSSDCPLASSNPSSRNSCLHILGKAAFSGECDVVFRNSSPFLVVKGNQNCDVA